MQDIGSISGESLDELTLKNANPHLEQILRRSLVGDAYRQGAPNERKQLRKRSKRQQSARVSGKGWFNLKSAPLTADNKRELQMLQLRPYIFKDRHIKTDRQGTPKFFQVGRVLSGAHEFYSSRIPKREQKRTFVEELISDKSFTDYAKKKYAEKQQAGQSKRRRTMPASRGGRGGRGGAMRGGHRRVKT
jgi:hypothetical protein